VGSTCCEDSCAGCFSRSNTGRCVFDNERWTSDNFFFLVERDLHSKGEALHPEAPRRYGSGKGFPRVTESAVTKTLGVGSPAIGIAFPA
jgi:hypothetical protein